MFTCRHRQHFCSEILVPGFMSKNIYLFIGIFSLHDCTFICVYSGLFYCQGYIEYKNIAMSKINILSKTVIIKLI